MINAENQIAALEKEIQERRKQILELKKAEERFEVADYTFQNEKGESVQFSDLFDDKNELIIVHNMGKGCVYCTLWADTFNGFAEHIANRLPFYLSSPDAPEVMRNFKESRSWSFNMLSTAGNSFKKDMGFFVEEKGNYPGMSVFKKEGDKIFHTAKDFFGPGDQYCGIWPMIDLLEEGVDGWTPRYSYS